MDKIGDQIAQLRKQAGLSQEELAEKADVARQTVSKWELNTLQPKADKILVLCEIFNVSSNVLLQNGDENKALGERALSAGSEETAKTGKSRKKLSFEQKTLFGIVTGVISAFVIAVAVILLCLLYNYDDNEGDETVTSIVFGISNGGLIAVIVIAAVLLISVCALIAYKLIKKSKNKK